MHTASPGTPKGSEPDGGLTILWHTIGPDASPACTVGSHSDVGFRGPADTRRGGPPNP
ncbi:hypothetical protein GCM10022377_00800 [Zhihengliuella alba]|uniref:Uncharacterized protein n=1 Tax=Zhihengliuella alba TaxID=547018 RepID=A0ABP7CL31_9MICC